VYQYSDFDVYADGTLHLKEGVVDISEHATEAVAPGFVKYKDMDGDGVITTEDRTIIGNGQPDWFGGITNTLKYRNVDLSFMFQFSVGNEVYNAQRMWSTQSRLEMQNMLSEVADRWTATNASNKVPSAKGYVAYDVYSRFIEDGSFLRLKNITLGYTLPKHIVGKYHISNLRLYATAQNLWCLTNYSGYDPEVSMRSSNLMPAFDYGAYPKSKVVTFGVELKF
ncbi:MAG: SusC/RagA family TonB-linked outer membrane protein, partial [Tidjanibacter sp.]|nr:SusC/RagA family TonB-linked outer membrane protein [Tidjanibacter sp.]